MSNIRVIGQHRSYATFDGMVWNLPGEYMSDVEWALRYGQPTKQQLLYAAGVIEAYRQMVADPEEKRRKVIRALRSAQRTGADHG
jgi:hypothetical protein